MQTRPSPGLWKHLTLILFLALVGGSLPAQTNTPVRKYSSVERMQTAHLKAAHADALRLQQQRQTLPPLPGLHDYRSILHAHAEDSTHTGGTRPEMLVDARKAGVQAILLTDHFRPPRDFIRQSWHGFHEGVLFIPGAEARGFLLYPVNSIMDRMEAPRPEFIASVTASNGLIFLSHVEERLDHPMDGLTGMEIYNRHIDAKNDMAGLVALALKLLDPAGIAELQENLRLYPDEMLAAQVTYLQDYIIKWDAETQTRRLTGVAANDCHHNMVMVVKMVDENTVRFGTSVDKDEDLRKATAGSRPGHPQVDQGPQARRHTGARRFRSLLSLLPGRNNAHPGTGADRERYPRRAAARSRLRLPRLDVRRHGFFLLCCRRRPGAHGGRSANYAEGEKLRTRFPVACHIRLLRNGKVIADLESDQLDYAISGPGVYRVEGWLKLDGEDRPWIYSNPIYVR